MKKILSVLALGAAVMTANAQQAYVGNKFADNWSLGVVAGGVTKTTHNAFWGGMRPTYGLELTKSLTPVFGLGIQAKVNNNTTGAKTAFDQVDAALLGKVNLFNLFAGYNGTPRLFEVEAAVGLGLGHNFGGMDDENFMFSKYGLNFNFNLGESKAWTVSVKPSIVYDMTSNHKAYWHNVNRSNIELLAGVTYHFKSSNGKHHFTNMREYDQAEVDGLNAKINDLRSTVASKDNTIGTKDAEIRNLQQQLNAARNSNNGEKCDKNCSASGLETIVIFRQGKATIDGSQALNVERIANMLKNDKNATVVVKGYASPEGSASFNKRLAQKRADAVKKLLVKKYKVDANRIKAEGQGVGSMFSKPAWNRVSISTVQPSK